MLPRLAPARASAWLQPNCWGQRLGLVAAAHRVLHLPACYCLHAGACSVCTGLCFSLRNRNEAGPHSSSERVPGPRQCWARRCEWATSSQRASFQAGAKCCVSRAGYLECVPCCRALSTSTAPALAATQVAQRQAQVVCAAQALLATRLISGPFGAFACGGALLSVCCWPVCRTVYIQCAIPSKSERFDILVDSGVRQQSSAACSVCIEVSCIFVHIQM